MTIFVQEEEDLFRRFMETHLQKGYTPIQMRNFLEQAGMTVVEMLDADTDGKLTDETERVLVVAREKGKESL